MPNIYKSSCANDPASHGVNNSSTPVLAANANRQYAVICNIHASPVYLSLGTPAILEKGIYLAAVNNPGSRYEITPLNLHLGAVYAICTPGLQYVTTQEWDS